MSIRDIFSSFTNMNTEQLQSFINANKEGNFVLLDVRQPSEYESARIPGSQLMPLPTLNERLQDPIPAVARLKPVDAASDFKRATAGIGS